MRLKDMLAAVAAEAVVVVTAAAVVVDVAVVEVLPMCLLCMFQRPDVAVAGVVELPAVVAVVVEQPRHVAAVAAVVAGRPTAAAAGDTADKPLVARRRGPVYFYIYIGQS